MRWVMLHLSDGPIRDDDTHYWFLAPVWGVLTCSVSVLLSTIYWDAIPTW